MSRKPKPGLTVDQVVKLIVAITSLNRGDPQLAEIAGCAGGHLLAQMPAWLG